MRAGEIAKACGGNVHRSGDWWRCTCPVHGSRTGRSATLAMRDGDHGLIAVCHAGCTRGDILAELSRRGLVEATTNTPSRRYTAHLRPTTAPRTLDDAARLALAQRLWNSTQAPHGTPVAAYLAGRGLVIDLPPTLRWAPSLRRLDGSYGPAMVGLVEHVERGVVGIHRTWIGADVTTGIWHRVDRASLGPIGGGAVRLAPATRTLMVGEGTETCIAAVQATTMPAWAALSTSGLVSLILPQIVRDVIILTDNDVSGAGLRAAWNVADRWMAEGRTVRVALPPDPGSDFNDLLLRGPALQPHGVENA